jgi:exosortase/archaeosortase family protein
MSVSIFDSVRSLVNKRLSIYLLKFIGAFCFFYYGTLAIIGLSAPEGYYSSFVDNYLNFIPAFRNFILFATKQVLAILGYESFQKTATQLRIVGGGGVNIVYSCLGYGVTSFWLAFVFANTGTWKKKLAWMVGGALVLLVINVLRVSLVALASHNRWAFPLGLDHHTWFNIAAYGMIFLMIWVYDRGNKISGNGQKVLVTGKKEAEEKEK